MQWLSPSLLAIQVISSLAIIALVLLQQGKGADMGSSFGGGSAGSLFGATGAANFLSRCTKWAAIIFFASTIGLAYVSHRPTTPSAVEGGVMQGFESRAVPAVPGAAPGASSNVVPSVSGNAAVVPAVPAAPAAEPVAPAMSGAQGTSNQPTTEPAGSTPASPSVPSAPSTEKSSEQGVDASVPAVPAESK